MLLAILGPTASAKSEVALALARRLGGRILSVDSMQVYRGMDIGTAKPNAQQLAEIEHGMIDVVDPEREFSVAEFQRAARHFIDRRPDRPVIVVGGSGLHFRAVVDPLTFESTDPELRSELEGAELGALRDELTRADPDAGDVIDLSNRRRVVRAVEILRLTGRTPSRRASSVEAQRVDAYDAEVPFRAVGLDPMEAAPERIAERVEGMREAGLLHEVDRLSDRLGRTASQAVGYKELLPVVRNEADPESGFAEIVTATNGLVRRQRTYFRRDPRIRWRPWMSDARARLDDVVAALEVEG